MHIAITSTPLQITLRMISAVLLALALVLLATDLFASLHVEGNSALNGSSGFVMVLHVRLVTILGRLGQEVELSINVRPRVPRETGAGTGSVLI